MAMIVFTSAKGAPGVTTSVALLATVWPRPVVVVDADPSGGEMTSGWLKVPSANGFLQPDRSLLSFVIESRYSGTDGRTALQPHLQPVADVPNCRLLAGFKESAHVRFVDPAGWSRLAGALTELNRTDPGRTDVLVDCGRFGPDTPEALLTVADLILVTTRSTERHAMAARCLATRLGSVVEPERLGLAICAASTFDSCRVERQTGLYAVVTLPNGGRVARVFSDGARRPAGFHRSRLTRAAARTAVTLHLTLNQNDDTRPRASAA